MLAPNASSAFPPVADPVACEGASQRDGATTGYGWCDRSSYQTMCPRYHLSKWVTSFGFSLNLGGDPTPSRFIRPCGLPGVHLTTVSAVTGQEPQRNLVISMILEHFQEVFIRTLKKSDLELEERITKLPCGHSPLQEY